MKSSQRSSRVSHFPVGKSLVFSGNKSSVFQPNPASIAVLGPRFTHSDIAADHCTKRFVKKHFAKKYCSDITKVFQAVAENKTQYAIVPIENSLNGEVLETKKALMEYKEKYKIKILKTFWMPIHHMLMAKMPNRFKKNNEIRRSEEVVDIFQRFALKNIKIIASHEQAVGQCGNFLKKYFSETQKKFFSSTAKAAQYAQKNPTAAAISHEKAAQYYGLKILKRNIEDHADGKVNKTKFIVFQSIKNR